MFEMKVKDCVSGMQNGDKDAFARLYNDLKQPVFTIVYRIVQSKEIAQDVTHDVFVKLFVSPPDPAIRNPRAWIFQMARNSAIDALRKKQSIPLDDVELAAKDELSNRILRWDIEAAIGRLTRDEREVVTLHINAELPFVEIAHIVGLSLPATYRKYRKAVKTLRELLGGGAL